MKDRMLRGVLASALAVSSAAADRAARADEPAVPSPQPQAPAAPGPYPSSQDGTGRYAMPGAPGMAAPGTPGATDGSGVPFDAGAGAAPGMDAAPGAAPGAGAPGAGAAAPTAGLGGVASGGGGSLSMLGDKEPILRILQVNGPDRPPIPGEPPAEGLSGVSIIPSVRGFKVCENQSPRPQDRFYFSFNLFDDLGKTTNQRLGAPISNIRVYREILGVEKTFWDESASIGLRLPINTLSADSPLQSLRGTSTAVGDLALILKYAFWEDRDSGSLMSLGALITMPTGPDRFAGFANINSPHNASITPYLGYIANFESWYFHGFSSIDVPFNPNDVTIIYNDLGLGYYAYRNADPCACLRAIIPTFEAHINTPVNHDDVNDLSDPAGTPRAIVNLTGGVSFALGERSLLSFGYVTPVTGPSPFDYELIFQFNWFF